MTDRPEEKEKPHLQYCKDHRTIVFPFKDKLACCLYAEVERLRGDKDALHDCMNDLSLKQEATIATLREALDKAIRWAEFTDEQIDELREAPAATKPMK